MDRLCQLLTSHYYAMTVAVITMTIGVAGHGPARLKTLTVPWGDPDGFMEANAA
jgi:hypothetical protein